MQKEEIEEQEIEEQMRYALEIFKKISPKQQRESDIDGQQVKWQNDVGKDCESNIKKAEVHLDVDLIEIKLEIEEPPQINGGEIEVRQEREEPLQLNGGGVEEKRGEIEARPEAGQTGILKETHVLQVGRDKVTLAPECPVQGGEQTLQNSPVINKFNPQSSQALNWLKDSDWLGAGVYSKSGIVTAGMLETSKLKLSMRFDWCISYQCRWQEFELPGLGTSKKSGKPGLWPWLWYEPG